MSLLSSVAEPTNPSKVSKKQKEALEELEELQREELEEDNSGYKNSVTGELGGPKGPEPTRYGDWERKGRVSDF